MFNNTTNIVEHLKFKKKNIIRLIYFAIFFLWVIGYFLIKKIEGSNAEANLYFTFGFVFTLVSLITAKFIPNDRESTLNFCKFGMLGYVLYTILFEILIFVAFAGGDGQGSNTAIVLRTVCGYSRAIIPLGLILWQAKKWIFMSGLRKGKTKTIEHLKRHGNDGMN